MSTVKIFFSSKFSPFAMSKVYSKVMQLYIYLFFFILE